MITSPNGSSLLHDGEAAVRELTSDALHSTEAAIDRVATRAQDLANRGIHAASDASATAKKQLDQYTQATARYVADQPVKSVLIAAAVGAALAALVISARGRHHPH